MAFGNFLCLGVDGEGAVKVPVCKIIISIFNTQREMFHSIGLYIQFSGRLLEQCLKWELYIHSVEGDDVEDNSEEMDRIVEEPQYETVTIRTPNHIERKERGHPCVKICLTCPVFASPRRMRSKLLLWKDTTTSMPGTARMDQNTNTHRHTTHLFSRKKKKKMSGRN